MIQSLDRKARQRTILFPQLIKQTNRFFPRATVTSQNAHEAYFLKQTSGDCFVSAFLSCAGARRQAHSTYHFDHQPLSNTRPYSGLEGPNNVKNLLCSSCLSSILLWYFLKLFWWPGFIRVFESPFVSLIQIVKLDEPLFNFVLFGVTEDV